MGKACTACHHDLTTDVSFCPFCGADLPEDDSPEEDPLVGTVLAHKFRILSQLGEGGMGRVYKAEQQPLGTEVCIKTLHPHLRADKMVVKRFFREAQAVARLRHPNCVTVHDFGEAEGTFYIAMEFLRGRSLYDVLAADAPLPPARAVKIVSQVLDVLEAAHRMQIVHRDLKPDNIMVEDLPTQRDFAKVLDFGIAKIVDPFGAEATRLTRTGMVFGTPSHIAPEQALGQTVDGRADLYAVGVILFEMLTGALPFSSSNVALLLAKHANEPAPPVLTRKPELPPRLAALVDRALSKSPASRPQTALEFKEELESSLRGEFRAENPEPARQAVAETMALEPSKPTGPTPAPNGALRSAELGRPAKSPAQMGGGDAHARTVAPETAEAPPPPRETAIVPCPQCGTPNSGSAKFCGECGAPVARAITSLTDKFSDLRRFLPSQVVDEVVQTGARLPGEKREVVVLSIDLGGPAVHEADPETAAATIAQFGALVADLALRHGGSLDPNVGHSMKVVFGLPITNADDPERAVRLALALRAMGQEFSQGKPRELTQSVGIHCGQVLVSRTLSGAKTDVAPVGDAVDLAKRIAEAAAPGQILVSETIQKHCRGSVGLRPLVPISIKGRSAAVPIFEVTGARAHKGTAHGTQLATPPLVGRRAELDTVFALTADVRAGLILEIVGEPGVGKSRLCEELTCELTTRGFLAVLVSARPGDDGESPMIRDFLRALGGTVQSIKAFGLPASELSFLGRYLGEANRPRYLGEEELRAGTASAVATVLERAAVRMPLALVCDDVHLADGMTCELLRRMTAVPMPRTVTFLSHRKGYDLSFLSKDVPALASLTLANLDDSAIEAVVEGALAPTPPPPALRDAVRRRASGSPFMALELLRSLIDIGILVSTGGRWTLTGDPDAVASPAGIRPLIAARLDALQPEARFVLALAAVIGDEFSLEVVSLVVQAAAAPERSLAKLTSSGLVKPGTAAGRFVFAQPLIREVAYARLVKATREQLHRRVAGALETFVGPDGTTGPLAELGHHYLMGDDRERALKVLARAVKAALAKGEISKAVALLRRSLEAARRDLDGPSRDQRVRRFVEDSLALGGLLLEMGEVAEVIKVVKEGLIHARKEDDPLLTTHLRRVHGRALMHKGEVYEASQELDGAMEVALGLRERGLLAELHGDLGELYEKRGQLESAADYFLRALELSQTGTADEVQKTALRVLNALGRVHVRWKNLDRAALFFQQALDLAEKLDDKLGAERALGNLGAVYHARREPETATRFVEKALALAAEIGDQIGLSKQQQNLGVLLLSTGKADQAQEHLNAAYATARKVGWREGMATAAASLERVRRGR